MYNAKKLLKKISSEIELLRKTSSKAQSAIEYLTTYGWAIIIIVVVLAALFGLGLFRANNYVQSFCSLPSGLTCSFISFSTSGILTVQIGNTMHNPITITALGCNTNRTTAYMQAPYNPPSNQVYLPEGTSQVFNFQCYKNSVIYYGSLGSLFSGYLSLNYTDNLTGIGSTLFGNVEAKVSILTT
ncbi:MAG: hypothetical protein ACP5RT_02955 [Candidatus Micrarchaeia archaeon]